jgi:hypothetical protein
MSRDQGDHAADIPVDFLTASPTDVGELQLAYLARLRRLVSTHRSKGREVNPEVVRLLNRSIYVAFCDCREVGCGAYASSILPKGPLGPTEANPTEADPVLLQWVYLRRLRRLLQLRKDHEGQLNRDGLLLLDKSIYATNCDCITVGGGEEASRIIQKF